MRKIHSFQDIISLLKSIPVEEIANQKQLPRNYYLALVALGRLQEAGEFLQKLAAHLEIDIEDKIKILDLIEQSARETLATTQPETLQTVLKQIHEFNFLPEKVRWQPQA